MMIFKYFCAFYFKKEVLATGLVNMGNTCYMNSSIQCLRRIDELKNYLVNNRFAPNGDPKSLLVTKALAGLFRDLEGKGQAI